MSSSHDPTAAGLSSSQPSAARVGTRQESFESRGKRGSSASTAQSRAAIYGQPLPLYLSPSNNEALSLLWSITWTLSLSCQVIASQFKPKSSSRNRIPPSAYLDEKIQGYYDERTKSVWVYPYRLRQQTKTTRRRRNKSAKQVGEETTSRDHASTSSSAGTAINDLEDSGGKEKEQTLWMDQLWKKGFFGKGSLSRSEPTWWQREKNRVTGEHVPTAEDITSARRAERIIVKKQKAQERAAEKEKQALALAEKSSSKEEDGNDATLPTSEVEATSSAAATAAQPSLSKAEIREATEQALEQVSDTTSTAAILTTAEENLNKVQSNKQEHTSSSLSSSSSKPEDLQSETKVHAPRGMPKAVASRLPLPNVTLATAKQEARIAELSIEIPNLEYTQLQREEAFFLVLCTGSLDVYNKVPSLSSSSASSSSSSSSLSPRSGKEEEEANPMTLLELWDLFLRASLPYSAMLSEMELRSIRIRPDNPFILSYVVYHHYRSLGWVVRNGVKFCVDWVLYKGADGVVNMRGGAGPVGGHAEFAVAIIPTYEDPSDAPSSAHLKYRRDWRWLNTVNRVCSGVKKTVILTYVTIPRMCDHKSDKDGNLIEWKTPGCLKHYTIQEVSIRRFIPTRMRD